MSATLESASKKRLKPWLALLAVFALALPSYGVAASARADEAPSWSTLPTTWEGQRITFDTRMHWQNVTAGAADPMVRYKSVWTPFTITLPTAEEVGQPQNYKDANGNPNYVLKGWAVSGKATDGQATQVRYFAPGEAVTIDNTFLNDNEEVIFLADWEPANYNFGSASDTQLGGVKQDMLQTEAIKTKMYDIWAGVYNQQHLRYTGNGWSDNHSGPVFIDHESVDGPNGSFGAVARPNDNWTLETEAGYNASVNGWTGSGGGAAQGLWDAINAGQMFDESTPGVTYVGDANAGPLFYEETNPDSAFKGYYVYNSDDHAATYNKDERKFYVYNQPQKINSYGTEAPAFLPFNEARDAAYGANNSGEINYHFGMVTEIDFFLTGDVGAEGANKIEIDGVEKDMEFYFSGDDDVWVFVDGQLALDIGGIHSRTQGSINFATGEVKTSRSNGIGAASEVLNNQSIAGLGRGNHTMTVYYLERGSNQSNNLTAFLLTLPTSLQIQKLESQTNESVVYPGATFLLQNEEGNYYHLDEANPNDPLAVPEVSYVADKASATRVVADENGVITVRYIVDGEYVLIEEQAPDNYVGLPGSVGFTVKNAKIERDSLTFEANKEYSDEDKPYTADDEWTDQITVGENDVTLNVSNDRRQWPLNIVKSFKGLKKPYAEVPFKVYEVAKTPANPNLGGVPSDATLIYEGSTDGNGALKGGALELKQGSLYYIVEDFADETVHSLSAPVVVSVTADGPQMLAGAENYEGTEMASLIPASDAKDAELTITNVPDVDEPEIEKLVTTSLTDINKAHGDLDALDEVYTYTVNTSMPKNAKGFTITDTIDDVLAFASAANAVQVRVDGKAAGTASISGQKLTVDFTEAEVSANAGKPVQVVFTAKIKVSDKDLVEKYADRTVPNKAQYTITNLDGEELDPKDSNEVTVTPPTPGEQEDPVKTVNGAKDTVDANGTRVADAEVARGEVFTYKVSQKIPAQAGKVVFTDTLEDVLQIVGTPTIDAVDGTVAVDGQKVTATIADARSLAGQTVTLTIQAKIRENADLSDYADELVPNEARVKIGDDDPKVTNEVLVTPPTPDVEKPKKTVSKRYLDARDEVFTYTVSQKIPAGAKSAVFTDVLVDELEVVGTPTVSADGSTVRVDGQTVSASLAGDALKAQWGKDVTLTVQAKIRDSVKDADLLAKYGASGTVNIPNKANVAIDGKGQPTNEVVVTPPPGSVRVQHVTEDGTELKPWEDVKRDVPGGTEYVTSEETFPGYEYVKLHDDSAPAEGRVVSGETLDVIYVYRPVVTVPVKAVNGDTEKVSLKSRPEEFTYSVSRVIPGGAVDVVFTDTLEDVLEVVGTPSVSADGVDVDGFTVKVDGQTVSAVIADARGLAGKNVTLSIRAKIRDEVTNAQLIERYGSLDVPNVASVSVDGDGKVTNRVLVTPPPPTRGEDVIPFYVAVSKLMGLSVVSELEGAKLQISNADTGEVWAEWISGAQAWYDYVAAGSWVLSEVEAPAGFDVAPPITFTVNADGTVSGESEFISADANSVTMIDPPNSPQIVKAVNKAAHADLASVGEVFTYDVSSFVTGDAVSLKVTDMLVDELEFATGVDAVKVSVNGADVAADVVIDGQMLTVTVADVAAFRGSFVDVSFMARIREGADCSKYEVDGVVLVPNTAGYTITNVAGEEITTESNTVTVTPPVPAKPDNPEPGKTPSPVPTPSVTKPLVKTGAGVGLSLAMVAVLLAGGVSLVVMRRREV